MVLRGRVENGAVVLDEQAMLPEGAEVRIEFVLPRGKSTPNPLSLRGLPYKFDDALSPAAPDSEWEGDSTCAK